MHVVRIDVKVRMPAIEKQTQVKKSNPHEREDTIFYVVRRRLVSTGNDNQSTEVLDRTLQSLTCIFFLLNYI